MSIDYSKPPNVNAKAYVYNILITIREMQVELRLVGLITGQKDQCNHSLACKNERA